MVLQIVLTQGLKRHSEMSSPKIFLRIEAIVIIAHRLDLAHFTASNYSQDCTNAGGARIAGLLPLAGQTG